MPSIREQIDACQAAVAATIHCEKDSEITIDYGSNPADCSDPPGGGTSPGSDADEGDQSRSENGNGKDNGRNKNGNK